MPAYGCIFPSVPKKGSQPRSELPENGHFLTFPAKLLGVLGEKQSKWPKKGVQNAHFGVCFRSFIGIICSEDHVYRL